jgi:hypothetical protein
LPTARRKRCARCEARGDGAQPNTQTRP